MRIRFPSDLVREIVHIKDRIGQLAEPPTEGFTDLPSDRAAHSLWAALDFGNGYLDASWRHPLDVQNGRWWPLILTDQQTPLDRAYWNRRVTWLDENGDERQSGEGCRAYFHGWQILLLAEAERSRIEIYATETFRKAFRSPGVEMQPSLSGSYATERFDGYHAMRTLLEHRPCLEAASWFGMYTNTAFSPRSLKRVERTASGDRAMLCHVASEAVGRFSVSSSVLVEAIGALSALWSEWDQKMDRPKVAAAYSAIIGVMGELWIAHTGGTRDELEALVGKRAGWTKPILGVIFPNWRAEGQSALLRMMSKPTTRAARLFEIAGWHWNKETAQSFVSWLNANGLHAVFWALDGIIRAGRSDDAVTREAITRECLLMAVTMERILVSLGVDELVTLDRKKNSKGRISDVDRMTALFLRSNISSPCLPELYKIRKEAFDMAKHDPGKRWTDLTASLEPKPADSPGRELTATLMRVHLARDLFAHGRRFEATTQELIDIAMSTLAVIAFYWQCGQRGSIPP